MNVHPAQISSARRLLERVLKLLDPAPALRVWEWAELRRRMGRNVTARPGPYRVASSPYQKEPQEAFTDQEVQTTVLYWASRLGKTEMINNLIGWIMEQCPRNILIVYPTLDSAKKWMRQFFTPMVRSTPALRDRIKDPRSRDANNTTLSKEFPGGTISAIGANSPSALRQVQAPVVVDDEIDAMADGPEGDPVDLSFKRAENYPDSIQVASSTATRTFRKADSGAAAGGKQASTGSRIHDLWLKSDQRKWFVPCHACGKFHVLMWLNVKWPMGHKHEEAWYECPDCQAHWSDEQRVENICRGEWRATAPFKGIRGYWLNGINTTFPAKKGFKSKLHQMAAEFYQAFTKSEAARITWKNTFLCEPHEEESERLEASPLLERCENYKADALPDQVVVLGMTCDVQGDRIEFEAVGMGEGEETWGVQYGRIFGNPELPEIWNDLAAQITKTFKRRDGTVLPITATAIDLGFKPKEVRRFIKTCGIPRVYGVYGASSTQTALVIPKQNKHYRMYSYAIKTDAAKDIIFARLRLDSMGPRFMHFTTAGGYADNPDSDASYFKMLTAEEVRTKYTRGYPQREYVKVRPRNEALDIRVYFLALMDILKPNIKAIAQGLEAQREKALGPGKIGRVYEVASSAGEAGSSSPQPSPPSAMEEREKIAEAGAAANPAAQVVKQLKRQRMKIKMGGGIKF